MRVSSRKGYTLIEVVVVVATLGVLASTSLVVLNALEKLRRSNIAQTASVRETQRFADSLRRVARVASAAEVETNGNSVSMMDNRYEHRFAESSDKLFIDYIGTPRANSDAVRHDRFMIGQHTELSFTRAEQSPLVSVEWIREVGVATELRIEAALASVDQVESESP